MKSLPVMLFWALVFILVGLLFFPTFLLLSNIWQNDPNYSHGFLVIPISLLAAWRCWKRKDPGEGELLLGGMYVVLGLFFHFLMLVILWPPIDFLALLAILRGILIAGGGKTWANQFFFPLLFLFFMFPLPYGWTSSIALWLQGKVSEVSGEILGIFFTCWQHGNTIEIAEIKEPLFVGQECSGIRQTMAFLALGSVLGFFLNRPIWHRMVLLICSLPVAFLSNVLRILLMALILRFLGGDWISGKLHDVPAILTFPIGLGMYFFLDGMIGKQESVSPQSRGTPINQS